MTLHEPTTIKLLGVRGSVPVWGPEYARYGGATSCVLVRMAGECILLDAGTGLMTGDAELAAGEGKLSILLSHPHLDHLQGFCGCDWFYRPDYAIEVYSRPRGGLAVREQIAALMSAPLWPVGPDNFGAAVRYVDIGAARFDIGAVRLDTMESNHPGGSTIYKLCGEGKTVVYATDYEYDPAYSERLAAFAARCDLLIIDGQYTAEEYRSRRGWGHSAWMDAAGLGQRCQARRTIIFHHDPRRTDAELDAMQEALKDDFPQCSFGKCGEEIAL